uniref:Keratin, type I cytoskeletal 47 kDa-like isoform X2 n=1 Tax=Geotrypetes seraphini TaxID=260995 RepID=A0A6P8PJ52_GEOSA|nr:keratin, type I cytoskeletal 47 kDa-like isoform X2 [Geotrypetes seraphini]
MAFQAGSVSIRRVGGSIGGQHGVGFGGEGLYGQGISDGHVGSQSVRLGGSYGGRQAGYGVSHGGFGVGHAGFSVGQAGFGAGQAGVCFGHDEAGFGSGGFGGDFGSVQVGGGEGLFLGSEKETMQNLNDRLASYLNKVDEMEHSNAELERKIKEWYEKHHPGATTGGPGRDYSKYFQIIEDLHKKKLAAIIDNNRIILQIDNARLAADDFRMKFDNEQALRQAVQADINGLHRVFDELNTTSADLESQLESLIEELAFLKKNHEEEVKGIKGTGVGNIDVQLNATAGNDLVKNLNDMRAQYELLAEKNRKDAEEDFIKRSGGLKQEISSNVQQSQSNKTELTDLRRNLQSLELELQSLHAKKRSLEESLAETEGRFCLQIAQAQSSINSSEEQLVAIRAEMEQQREDYDVLLNTKSQLEQEIATYRQLLDEQGGSGSSSGNSSSWSSGQASQGNERKERTWQQGNKSANNY